MLDAFVSIILISQLPSCLNQIDIQKNALPCVASTSLKAKTKKPANQTKTKSRYQPMGNGILLDTNSIQKVDVNSINYDVLKEEKNETGVVTHLWKWTVYCPSKVGNITKYSISENGNLKEEMSGEYNLRAVSLGNGESDFRRFGEYSEEGKDYRQYINKTLNPLPVFSKTLQYVCSKYK